MSQSGRGRERKSRRAHTRGGAGRRWRLGKTGGRDQVAAMSAKGNTILQLAGFWVGLVGPTR
jgi:hypothetical protein